MSVRGSLDREIIRRTIRRHINEVRFCYEQELAAHRDLGGALLHALAGDGAQGGCHRRPVTLLVRRQGEPMPGVPEAIAVFGRLGLRLAIASSSPIRLIDAVCARLNLDIDVRCSALDEPHGKPAPARYLAAARRLGLSPARCLAVEDSPAGVLAAKDAGMTCVAVPDPLLTGDPRYRRADLVLPSLTELTEPLLRRITT